LLQFQHTAWTEQNGAPSQIFATAQTTDGYLWLGTANGLFRFDGVTFELYRLPRGQQFASTSIQSLRATADGGLWIGYTLGNTSFLKNGVLETQLFRGHIRRANGTVWSIVVRRDGSTWAATNSGPIHLVSGEWQDADEVAGTDVKSSYSLFEDSQRALWMATDDFVYRLKDGAGKFEKTPLNGGGNAVFSESADGTIWIADQYGVHDIAAHLGPDGHPLSLIQFKDNAMDLRSDSGGALWVVGSQTGITRIEQPGTVLMLPTSAQHDALESYTIKNGLTSERGTTLLQDHEGNIWVSTADGLDRFRQTTLTPAPLPSKFAFYAVATEAAGAILVGTEDDGLQRLNSGKISKVPTGKETRIAYVYRAHDGKLWLGGFGDLGYLEADRFTAVPVPPDIKSPGRDTQAMTSGPGGDLWIQTVSNSGILRLHDGQWNRVPYSGPAKGAAVVMTTDRSGRVWAGYMSGFIAIFDGAKTTTLSREQGLTVGNVLALDPSTDGMWIGGENGLELMRTDRPVELRFAGDTKIQGISGILLMEDGTLWLNSLPGILRITSAEVSKALKDSTHAMQYRLFNYLDGLSGKAPQLRPMPSIIRGAGTTLWFTTTNGVVSLDTAHIPTNTIAPPVSIKDMVVDGQAHETAIAVALPKGAKDLQINYTALSLSIPERVRFRYKLDGYDKLWQDVGDRRQAFYTHLLPGHYVFHVIACNNDGLWNGTGASVSIYLPPTFLQSWYFKALLAVFFLGVTWLIYLLRMNYETIKLKERIQERLSERERIARELHDTLFQSVEGSLLHLHAVTSRLPVEQQVKDQLQQAYGEVDRVMGQARSLVFDLRQPVDSRDLASITTLFAEEVGGISDIQVEVRVRGKHMLLKPPVHDEVLKIVKECIWNAFRHAQAQRIAVTINYSSHFFEVSVKDDGVGIDAAILEHGGRDGHWGLLGIRERASALKALLLIQNQNEGGVEIVLRIKAREAYQWAGWFFPSRWWRFSRGMESERG
jgi:ligand-binding sensor domain-containing protein/two-component sensor histidine kinase